MYPILRTRDARYLQIFFQAIFLLYGIYYLNWTNEALCFFYYAWGAFTTQLLFEYLYNPRSITHRSFWVNYYYCSKSALITAFGLCLLLKTNHWYICLLAAFISIAGKFIFRYRKKHMFNPSALGIAATILLTGKAWINPGQWGNDMVILFGVCCLGCIVATRVQKLDVTLAFLATYAGLLFIRQVLYLGWPADFFIQSVSTGSLLLFAFFMVTDPKTAPDHKIARIIWAVIIGLLSFYLTAFRFINAAPVWVLVLSAPLVPILDTLFKGNRFQWISARMAFQNETMPLLQGQHENAQAVIQYQPNLQDTSTTLFNQQQ
jgi:enediyne biosynthesis protein E5